MIKFDNNTSMGEVRTTVIHEIVDDVTALNTTVADHTIEVKDHENRITALEEAGPGEGGNGGSGVSTFIALTDTPSVYTAGGYLRVNEDATGVEFHNPNEGDEQAYVNSIQVYGEFYIPMGSDEPGRTDRCSKSTYTMFSSNIDYIDLPEIVSTSTIPGDGQVRSGRVLSFVTFNAPATIKKPVASTGQRIYANGGLVDQLELATGENVEMYAMYNGSKFKHWIAVGGRYSLPTVTDPLPEDALIDMAE